MAPTVTSIDPKTGSESGGNLVTVEGSYFIKDYTTVKFGTKSATEVTVKSDTQLTCKAPPGDSGTTVNVVVDEPGRSSANTAADDYSYGIPTVLGLSPAAGPNAGGNTVIITGSAFVSGTVTKVAFVYRNNNGTPADSTDDFDQEYLAASYTVNSQTQITAIAPNTGGALNFKTVDVKVTNTTGTSATSDAASTASDRRPYPLSIRRVVRLPAVRLTR